MYRFFFHYDHYWITTDTVWFDITEFVGFQIPIPTKCPNVLCSSAGKKMLSVPSTISTTVGSGGAPCTRSWAPSRISVRPAAVSMRWESAPVLASAISCTWSRSRGSCVAICIRGAKRDVGVPAPVPHAGGRVPGRGSHGLHVTVPAGADVTEVTPCAEGLEFYG